MVLGLQWQRTDRRRHFGYEQARSRRGDPRQCVFVSLAKPDAVSNEQSNPEQHRHWLIQSDPDIDHHAQPDDYAVHESDADCKSDSVPEPDPVFQPVTDCEPDTDAESDADCEPDPVIKPSGVS